MFLPLLRLCANCYSDIISGLAFFFVKGDIASSLKMFVDKPALTFRLLGILGKSPFQFSSSFLRESRKRERVSKKCANQVSKEKQMDTFYLFSENVTSFLAHRSQWYGVGESPDGGKCFLFYCYPAKLLQERRETCPLLSACGRCQLLRLVLCRHTACGPSAGLADSLSQL